LEIREQIPDRFIRHLLERLGHHFLAHQFLRLGVLAGEDEFCALPAARASALVLSGQYGPPAQSVSS